MTATPEEYHDCMRNAVVEEARSWIGTPYHHESDVKGPQGGVDCAMILVRVFCDLGLVPQIDPRPYSAQWHLHRSEEKYLAWFTDYAHRTTDPKPGDVLLFRYGRTVSHSGILIAPGLMVHAFISEGVVPAETRAFADRLDSCWSVF